MLKQDKINKEDVITRNRYVSKGNVIPLQARCGQEGEYRCNSTLP